eukprot:19990-Heterococcus_DN1.PRE.1
MNDLTDETELLMKEEPFPAHACSLDSCSAVSLPPVYSRKQFTAVPRWCAAAPTTVPQQRERKANNLHACRQSNTCKQHNKTPAFNHDVTSLHKMH